MKEISEETLRIAYIMSRPIDARGLSTRTYYSLKRWGLVTVGDLYRAYTDGEIKKIRGIGCKSINEVEHFLKRLFSKEEKE